MATELITHGAPVAEQDRTVHGQPDRAALHAIRLVFDRCFYLERNPDVAASGIDPLDHFLTAGLGEGRSPCVLFDPDFYMQQPGAPGTRAHLFLHYLTTGIRGGLDPHPLLNAGFYRSQLPVLQAATNPLTHLLGAGRRENRRPNPLFDPAYYRRRQKGADHALHPLIHYAMSGWRERLQPHPLFDPTAYLETRPDIGAAGIDPLAHYLHHGRHEQTRPNWLFDAHHYAAGGPGDLTPETALLHYATHAGGQGRSPHPLFDIAHYVKQHPDLVRSAADPFLHFLEFGLAANQDPHPLFDGWFYRSQNADVAESGMPPFLHYVRHGAREGRDPNPFFPAAIYLVRHPEATGEAAGPLAHFLALPAAHLERLCDAFDPEYYRDCHPGCAEAAADGVPPLSHYLAAGRAEQLSPVVRPIEQHSWTAPDPAAPAHAVPAPATSDGAGHERGAAILLVVHEATLGDAARCALEAVRQMAADQSMRCRIVIRRDGPLKAAFAALAPTIVIQADGAAGGTAQLADILYSFRAHAPEGLVIVTSASMPDVVALTGRLRLRLLAWLHETPVSIDSLLGGADTMQTLQRTATRILTGSAAARDALVDRYGLPPHQVVVVADGVTAPATSDLRETRLALRDRLGLPPDALVVLGTGGIEFRNGTDLFIRVGHQVVSRGGYEAAADSALRQAFFLWMGPADDPLFAALCRNDIQRLGLSDRIRLIELGDDPGHALPGADLLLLTARDAISDMTALEALSGGLPVVGFVGAGGTSLGSDGRLNEIAYLDLDAMADAVMTIGNRPARRSRNSLPRRVTGPSWSSWLQGVRQLLAEDYGMAPSDPVAGRIATIVRPPTPKRAASRARPRIGPGGDAMPTPLPTGIQPGVAQPQAVADKAG